MHFGSFTAFKLLSARGPGIKINRVYLQVKCTVNILTPFDNIEKEITNQVLLVENVIVGNIPSTYYNLEGLEQRDSIELVE